MSNLRYRGLAQGIQGFPRKQRFSWPLSIMEDVCTLHYGKALTVHNRTVGHVPVYGTNGICGWHSHALGRGPTVILGRKGMGNLGVEWCAGDFWVIDTAYYTTFPRKTYPRFFYYYVNYVGLNHLKDGTSNPSLTRETFARQPFPLPSYAEQRAIASILHTLDDKIELNRRMNETLEAMARAIFKSWFVDFDPVRAKAEGRQPFGMDGATSALFPDRFGPDGLPDGWRFGPPLELARILSGGTPKTTEPDYWDGAVPWATAKDVSQCSATFLIKTERSISELGLNSSSAKIVPARSTVVVARGATTAAIACLARILR